MKKTILVILDGCGLREETKGNAFKNANLVTFNYLWNKYPHSKLIASGKEVGLPDGQMGNSEVGHLNIGAGRVVLQPLQLINEEIKSKKFFDNKYIKEVINHVKINNSNLHVFGLLSDGGVHSHINHLMSLIDMIKANNINKVYYHVFLDGRDTLPNLKEKFINKLLIKIKETGIGEIATVSGRFYAMDRDNRWERIKKTYDAIVNNEGIKFNNINEFLDNNKEVNDEFVEPSIIGKISSLNNNDGLIVYNFRADRLRELFSSISNPAFNSFSTKKLTNIKLLTFMEVPKEVICSNAYPSVHMADTLGEEISDYGYKQLRIAETEKYAHVTYFFDGGEDILLPREERILIPSPKVKTYDLKPEMSAYEITDKLLSVMNNYDFILVNYANGDMVGHTGNYEKTIEALRAVDYCLFRLYSKAREAGYTLIILADHGNCELMIDEYDNIITSHTNSLVPFIITTDEKINLKDGKLGDVAPTVLQYVGIPVPKIMEGNILIK